MPTDSNSNLDIFESDAKMLHASHLPGYQAFQAKLAKYIDPKTGLIAEEFVEHRNCPACGAGNAHKMFDKNGGTYVKCRDCTMVYVNPVMKDERLIAYYNENIDFNATRHANEIEFYSSIYRRGLTLIQQHVKGGDLLDVGSSDGLFLDVSKAAGWNSSGLELNRRELEVSLKKGHQARNIELSQVPVQEKFHVITMWDVFEHIKAGDAQLREAMKRLHPGGVIFLQIPSSSSLAARILHEKCNMFDGVEHVNLYSPKSVRILGERVGVKVLHFETVIDELKVIKNHLNYEDPYAGAFTSSEELNYLSKDLVLGADAGYKMQIVLQPLN